MCIYMMCVYTGTHKKHKNFNAKFSGYKKETPISPTPIPFSAFGFHRPSNYRTARGLRCYIVTLTDGEYWLKEIKFVFLD